MSIATRATSPVLLKENAEKMSLVLEHLFIPIKMRLYIANPNKDADTVISTLSEEHESHPEYDSTAYALHKCEERWYRYRSRLYPNNDVGSGLLKHSALSERVTSGTLDFQDQTLLFVAELTNEDARLIDGVDKTNGDLLKERYPLDKSQQAFCEALHNYRRQIGMMCLMYSYTGTISDTRLAEQKSMGFDAAEVVKHIQEIKTFAIDEELKLALMHCHKIYTIRSIDDPFGYQVLQELVKLGIQPGLYPGHFYYLMKEAEMTRGWSYANIKAVVNLYLDTGPVFNAQIMLDQLAENLTQNHISFFIIIHEVLRRHREKILTHKQLIQICDALQKFDWRQYHELHLAYSDAVAQQAKKNESVQITFSMFNKSIEVKQEMTANARLQFITANVAAFFRYALQLPCGRNSGMQPLDPSVCAKHMTKQKLIALHEELQQLLSKMETVQPYSSSEYAATLLTCIESVGDCRFLLPKEENKGVLSDGVIDAGEAWHHLQQDLMKSIGVKDLVEFLQKQSAIHDWKLNC